MTSSNPIPQSRFTVIPAIDLKGGRCVRLRQGRADDATVYSDDPVAMARHWESLGARYLHVVDLDGAFEGHPVHTGVISQIAQAIRMPLEVGGGLRSDADIRAVLDAGAARAILGTRASARPEDLEKLVERFGRRIAVGIDARNGRVQVRGWVETTPQDAVALAAQVSRAGVSTIIYTDTATDGMLAGPNVKAMEAVCRGVTCDVVASGGVTKADDIVALRRLGCGNLIGAIVGKALYEGRASLPDLARAAESPNA